ncbi:MAG TPA: hypothetical protein VNL35_05450 [Chloroflexota bacterium]|nr:hypothetical protein [Chloroflexota bacterium]
MKTDTPIDNAGTPQVNSLFAVFPDSDAYFRAEPELAALGLRPEQLRRHDAPVLDHPDADAGLLGTIGRFVKGIGGETNMAKNYVQHLREGRVVLACHVDDPQTAEKATRSITSHGGYEVTYFRPLGIQYMSPTENAEKGVSTHSLTNTDT